jgi:hypothetical protein
LQLPVKNVTRSQPLCKRLPIAFIIRVGQGAMRVM